MEKDEMGKVSFTLIHRQHTGYIKIFNKLEDYGLFFVEGIEISIEHLGLIGSTILEFKWDTAEKEHETSMSSISRMINTYIWSSSKRRASDFLFHQNYESGTVVIHFHWRKL